MSEEKLVTDTLRPVYGSFVSHTRDKSYRAGMSLVSRLHNEGPKLFFLALWYAANIVIFTFAFLKFNAGKEYFYLRLFLGPYLALARASAACINFNCILLVLPVCRNIISFAKLLPLPHPRLRRWLDRVLDKQVTFHRTVAGLICLLTIVHIASHTNNLHLFVSAWRPSNLTGGLLSTLSSLHANHNWVNPVRQPNAEAALELWRLVPGFTGVLITAALILIVTTSTEVLRRYQFELFWFSHHVFIVFFIALLAHGTQGVVRSQSNVAEHDPEKCASQFASWVPPGEKRAPGQCPTPQFAPTPAKSWQWLVVPIAIYCLERLVRFMRSRRPVEVIEAHMHKSNVLEIVMRLSDSHFSYLPGQYIFIQCATVSRLEWHPFTLTSAPDEPTFSVHIRGVGDWTDAVIALFRKALEQNSAFPRVAVDGPFGSPAEESFGYEANVLIGAGIGVTPFVSVLRHITMRLPQVGKLRKVHFFWLCPDHRQFEWFTAYLDRMERQLADKGQADFLELRIYLTRGWDGERTHQIVVSADAERDCFTGLQAKTHFGRPDWSRLFTGLAAEHEGTRVGVFFCGPKELSAQLHVICNRFSSAEKGTKFYYNKENF